MKALVLCVFQGSHFAFSKALLGYATPFLAADPNLAGFLSTVHYNLGKVDEGGRVICIPPRSFCMENHEWNLQGGHGDDPTAHG